MRRPESQKSKWIGIEVKKTILTMSVSWDWSRQGYTATTSHIAPLSKIQVLLSTVRQPQTRILVCFPFPDMRVSSQKENSLGTCPNSKSPNPTSFLQALRLVVDSALRNSYGNYTQPKVWYLHDDVEDMTPSLQFAITAYDSVWGHQAYIT